MWENHLAPYTSYYTICKRDLSRLKKGVVGGGWGGVGSTFIQSNLEDIYHPAD